MARQVPSGGAVAAAPAAASGGGGGGAAPAAAAEEEEKKEEKVSGYVSNDGGRPLTGGRRRNRTMTWVSVSLTKYSNVSVMYAVTTVR